MGRDRKISADRKIPVLRIPGPQIHKNHVSFLEYAEAICDEYDVSFREVFIDYDKDNKVNIFYLEDDSEIDETTEEETPERVECRPEPEVDAIRGSSIGLYSASEVDDTAFQEQSFSCDGGRQNQNHKGICDTGFHPKE